MKDEYYEFVKGADNKVRIAGFGSYGQVKLAKNSETGELVAIKMIPGKNLKNEIDVYHKLNHPNIIRLLNYYYQKQKNITYLVLQYADQATFYNKIRFSSGLLPKDKVKKYFRDICRAVEYLHSLKYMHRDIKPQNILLTKDGNAKLCDFGFAAILQFRSTLCGTFEYMAPEMIQEKPYDFKVDIWALGILLFELIQGFAPFQGETGHDVLDQMRKPIIFTKRFNQQQKDLIKKILRVKAENRPSIATILEQPYLAENKQKPLLQNFKQNSDKIRFSICQELQPVYEYPRHEQYSLTHQNIIQQKIKNHQKNKRADKIDNIDLIKQSEQLENKQKHNQSLKYYAKFKANSYHNPTKPPSPNAYIQNNCTKNHLQPFYVGLGSSSSQFHQQIDFNHLTFRVNQSMHNNSSNIQQSFDSSIQSQKRLPKNIPPKVSYKGETVRIENHSKSPNYNVPSNFVLAHNIHPEQIYQNIKIKQNLQNIPNNAQNIQNYYNAKQYQDNNQWRKN